MGDNKESDLKNEDEKYKTIIGIYSWSLANSFAFPAALGEGYAYPAVGLQL